MANRILEIAPAEIERRLKYVGLGPDDVVRIVGLRPVVEPHVDEIAGAFFSALSQFEEAKPLFTSRKTVDEARRLKRDHLIAMVKGEYDKTYVEQRIKLGNLYSAAGLEPMVFLGAFQQLMRNIGERVMSHYPAEVGFSNILALNKLAFFDIGIIVDTLIHERERTIRQQQESIRELSTPVLQLRDRLLILPIIGILDSVRARQLTENLLQSIRATRARMVVIDVTGVAAVDSKVANHLVQTVAASKLMGANVIVTGLSAEVAQTLVTLGVDLGRLTTLGDLQGGLEEAERMLGLKVVAADAVKNGREER